MSGARGKWWLRSAEDAHAKAPGSFFIPPLQKRESLEVGDVVKLLFEGPTTGGGTRIERMWVQVTEVGRGTYQGALLNEPSVLQLAEGARVAFAPEHVAACDWSPDELGYDPKEFALASARILRDGQAPAWMFKRTADQTYHWDNDVDRDSGWTIGADGDTPGDLGDVANFGFWSLGDITDHFPFLEGSIRSRNSWGAGADEMARACAFKPV